MNGPLPSLLIIGAQKAATTTLAEDLSQNPAVCFGVEKEPGFLVERHYSVGTTRSRYAAHFRECSGQPIQADASTAYSMYPTYSCAPERARNLMGPNLRIIYVIRDPIERIISQYRHERSVGLVDMPMDSALMHYSRYVDYSSYSMQIDRWLQFFPPCNFFLIYFESFIFHRQQTYREVCHFLGLPTSGIVIDASSVSNSSADAVRVKGVWRRIQTHRRYRALRTMLPGSLRTIPGALVRRLFGTTAGQDPCEQLGEATRYYLMERLEQECRRYRSNDYGLTTATVDRRGEAAESQGPRTRWDCSDSCW
jgi:hypothetical protein